MNAPTPTPAYKSGIVKQVLSGDTLTIRRIPKNGPPPEKTIILSGVAAPKLGKPKSAFNDVEVKDEPYAWEAREYLRKKLIGKEVFFTAQTHPHSATKEYGMVWAGTDPTKDENVIESMLALGLLKVKDGGRNLPQMKPLVEIEEAAKAQGKGIWGSDLSKHVREFKTIDSKDLKAYMTKLNGQPKKGIVEFVRDGSTLRVMLLPEYQQVTVMITGIRCPTIKDGESEPFADQAKYFVETNLLHREVEIILESVWNNNAFVGTVMLPNKGNIAVPLLKLGFAKVVDWSIAFMKSGADQLRQAQKSAKEEKVNIWANYQSNVQIIPAKEKEFQATVLEVGNGDNLVVKLANGTLKKIFLSSIKPPRDSAATAERNSPEENKSPKPRGRPLYDIPWMFQAREFLRTKVIGKKVNVVVDYIQPAANNFPEKTCCTVTIGGQNIAEALVSKGYATVIKYKSDNDQRSSQYDKLAEAEQSATKEGVGLHAKKDIPICRVQDINDAVKAKKFLPFLRRLQKTDAIVEFVASGSRLRLYIPKESVLVTLLLAGISCPKVSRPMPGGGMQKGEPFGEEALQFTKERCMQRNVCVTIEDVDKRGNFIGWLWVDNKNLSVSLVENGLASMFYLNDASEHNRAIKTAQEAAIKKRIGKWKDYVEPEEKSSVNDNHDSSVVPERVVKYDKVIVTEVTPEGTFWAQNIDNGAKLNALMDKIHQEFTSSPPLPGAYVPRRGQICAAKFTFDDQWYRAKIEKVQHNEISVLYIDYGNREVIHSSRLADLPAGTESDPAYSTEYALCCVRFPSDPEDRKDALQELFYETQNKTFLLNVEARTSPPSVTLVDSTNNCDIGKKLIKEGLVLFDNVRDRRLATLAAEYRAAQDQAKSSRMNLWQHGDITEDDDLEFGIRR